MLYDIRSGQTFPIEFGCLEEGECPHHVSTSKSEWVFDGAVNMRFSCKVDDAINMLILHQLVEGIKVADVHLDKLVVGLVLDVLQVCEVTRIRQLVEVNDFVLRIFVHEEADYMATNKTCPACDYDISFHFIQ